MDLILALGLSTHLGLANDYNEIHPHVRLKHDNFISGAYLNSENSLSMYGGLRYEYKDFGLEGALVTGYSMGDAVPMVRGTYNVTDKMVFFTSPAYETHNGEDAYGLVAGIEFQF